MKMKEICLLAMFFINGIYDMRYKKISLMVSMAFGVMGLFIQLSPLGMPLPLCAGGVLMGALLMLLSIWTKGQVGMGDGILLSISGLYLGLWENLGLMFGAMALAGICGTVYCVARRRGRKQEMPFIPFVFVTYAGMVVSRL